MHDEGNFVLAEPEESEVNAPKEEKRLVQDTLLSDMTGESPSANAEPEGFHG